MCGCGGCRGRGGAPFLCFSFVVWWLGTLLSALFYPFFRRVVVGSPWSGVFVRLGARVCVLCGVVVVSLCWGFVIHSRFYFLCL